MSALPEPADEHRCTATTARGARCRRVADNWPADAGENPRKCGGHLSSAQRAARDAAVNRVLALAFAPRTPEQRAAVERRARIFASAEPACWSWSPPTNAATWEPDIPPVGEGDHCITADAAAILREIYSDPENRDDALLRAWHDGRCAICEDRDYLVTDHDHVTGLVRGLLCRSCNTREGLNHQAGTVFAAYRERHPAAILGLTIRYLDPFTGEYAEPVLPRDMRRDNPMRGIGL